MSLLEVRGLSVRYAGDDGPVTAVRDVSFSLAPGRALGIVGESGSGKSSIAGAILDLLGPGADIQGSIVFEGRNLASLNPQQRRAMLGSRIGSVFQDPFTALNPALRVGHHIAEPLMQHRGANAMDAQRRAVELLAEMGITRPAEVARAFPHQLSGGMKQRALIAAALACEPSLLILDEPTTALDVTIQAQILEVLAEMKERLGMAIMLITHAMGVVAENAQRVVVMYAGVVVEEAPVDELFANPRHPYTQGLIRSIPRVDAKAVGRSRLEQIPGTVPNLLDLPPGCRFSSRCQFVSPACREAEPALRDVAPGHKAACIRA